MSLRGEIIYWLSKMLPGWRVVRNTPSATYYRHAITGNRKAKGKRQESGAWGPVDATWIRTGEWTSPLIPKIKDDLPN